jgi:hypothetical protein
MTSPTMEGRGGVAELTQSRNANAPEALAIFRTHMNAFKSGLAAVRRGRVVRFGPLIIGTVLGALTIIALESRWIPPTYTITAAVISAAVTLCLWQHFYYRRCAEVYRECFKAERRFRIEEHAVIVTSAPGVVSSVPWSAILDIVVSKDSLAIYLSPIEALFLPKAACEHQDVDGFCAELVRRWKTNRDAVRPGLAQ